MASPSKTLLRYPFPRGIPIFSSIPSTLGASISWDLIKIYIRAKEGSAAAVWVNEEKLGKSHTGILNSLPFLLGLKLDGSKAGKAGGFEGVASRDSPAYLGMGPSKVLKAKVWNESRNLMCAYVSGDNE